MISLVDLLRGSTHDYLEEIKQWHSAGGNLKRDQYYAVMWMVVYGHLKTLKWLYENGADITARKNRPLRMAVKMGHRDVVEWLLNNGAGENKDGSSPIGIAIDNKDFAMVKLLLGRGVSIFDTYLYNTVRMRNYNMVEWLFINGSPKNMNTFRRILVRAVKYRWVDAVRFLIAIGVDGYKLAWRDIWDAGPVIIKLFYDNRESMFDHYIDTVEERYMLHVKSGDYDEV